MENQTMISELKSIIQPYCNDATALENLTPASNFITDLKINSANLVDIILDIEEKYEIAIDTVSMEKMLDVQSALTIIQTKLAEK
ncbi:acyl carrier protein [Flavobacterium sp.]|jgi:acyl carrier protein|uniref:acyl carrier protein n=1 Tax=Flavobacterium sp. TaxID=239 RepID=UPI0037C03982